MLQGRRHQPIRQPNRPATARRRKSVRFVNRKVQKKYALIIGVTTTLFVSIFAFPAWYYFSQNSDLFLKLAYDTHPGLVAHFEREQYWMAFLLIAATLGSGLMAAWTTLRMTTYLMGPLLQIERHMREVITGDLSQPEFRIREEDEMQELSSTYAYLYRTLKVQSEKELEMLQKILVDDRDLESRKILQTLRTLKVKQLGISDATSEASALFQDSRRAS